jgi:arabinose-5-phosphate isomerase
MVYDDNEKAVGIITDGDIRRAIQRFDDLKNLTAQEFMTHGFKKIAQNEMLSEALEIMDENNITNLAVMENDSSSTVVGILSIHDIIDFK